MRRFHLILADGRERDITADSFRIETNGCLIFYNQNSQEVVAYSPTSWNAVEVEARDDKE